jgi:hypothetical protein
MPDLLQPLTPNDLLRLESILLEHRRDDEFDLVGLNGFMHGILCLSKPVNPSDWLQLAVPEVSLGHDTDGTNEIIGLVFRYFNMIAIPASHARANDGSSKGASNGEGDVPITPNCDGGFAQTKTWLNGFGRAFLLDRRGIEAVIDSEQNHISRLGMMVFSHAVDVNELRVAGLSTGLIKEFTQVHAHSLEQFKNNSPEENILILQATASLIGKMLVPARANGSSLGLETNSFSRPTGIPVRRDGPKVGRNDPCPCGSGKKFKQCHGA